MEGGKVVERERVIIGKNIFLNNIHNVTKSERIRGEYTKALKSG